MAVVPPTANIKLGLGCTGPYTIFEKVSELTYTIQKEEDCLSRIFNVHVDHLKPVLRNENIDVTNEIPVAIPIAGSLMVLWLRKSQYFRGQGVRSSHVTF